MRFVPDYRHFEAVMFNRQPERLPLYEHIISPQFMERVLDVRFADLITGNAHDLKEYFRHFCGFFKEMTYDTVSCEVCITEILPDSGALLGGRPGPIQNRADFERYPWSDLPEIFWAHATPKFDAMTASLLEGMMAVGGIGNGVFEICEDLVGLEYLPFMQVDDPDLYADLFNAVGELMTTLWRDFLLKYKSYFAACRFGDDLGFKSSLLTNPQTVRQHIVPQYRRVIDLVHNAGKRFIYHSCGCIFEVMEDMICAGIDAKHSNEDAIAPFPRWIGDYGDRIALLGGFDLDFICHQTADDIEKKVFEQGRQFRIDANGYALGSGNSIPDYVPVDNYLAMIEGTKRIRAN